MAAQQTDDVELAALVGALAQLLGEADVLAAEIAVEQRHPDVVAWGALAAHVAPIGTQAATPAARTQAAMERRALRLRRDASHLRARQALLLEEGQRIRAQQDPLLSRGRELCAWADAVAEHSRTVAAAARRELDTLGRRLDGKVR